MKPTYILLRKERMREYSVEVMVGADYANDLILLATAKAWSKLNNLEWAAENIGLNGIQNKTEFIYFKRKGAISVLNGKSLKLVFLFTYLRSNMSSTESYVNIIQMKT